VTLRLRVIPRAAKNALAGERDGALVVRLTAPPVEGAANDALLRFLSKALQVPRSAVTLVRGETSRDKVVRIDGLTPADLAARAGLSVD
jgi:uncharacterized protein (TIGR00251 family)